MSSLYEEVAGVALAEISSATEGNVPPDRFEDAKYYAKQAFTIMDAELPDLDPESDDPVEEAKRAATLYVKTQIAGKEAAVSQGFKRAVDLYARSAIEKKRRGKANNDNLVDDDARMDMFE